MLIRLPLSALAILALTFPVDAADQPRQVPDTPASFALTGDQHWIVVAERADGEAAIGLAREQVGETSKVQVARTKDGKYAVLVGPVPKMSDADLKSKYAEGGAARRSQTCASRRGKSLSRARGNSPTGGLPAANCRMASRSRSRPAASA